MSATQRSGTPAPGFEAAVKPRGGGTFSPVRAVAWAVGLLALLHGCSFMLRLTVDYTALNDEVGFLPLKRPYHQLFYWKAAFYTHVFGSILLVFAGLSQFLPIRNRRLAKLHRLCGRVYVGIVLLVAAPSGLVLACNAEGGWIAKTGFILLDLLWIFTTSMGLAAIKQRHLERHLAWMTRSYALTFSAITLREWQHWLDIWLPPTVDLVPITAWLGWTLNLLVAEIWLRCNAVGKRTTRVRNSMAI